MNLGALPPNLQTEEYSFALVRPIVAQCGFAFERTERDWLKIDFTIVAATGDSYRDPVELHVQMKGTRRISESDGFLSYHLRDIALYDRLRAVRDKVTIPHLVFVAVLPEEPADWVTTTDTGQHLAGEVYWASLRGLGPAASSFGVALHIPLSQRLTALELRRIMTHISETGSEPKGIEQP